MAMRAGGKRLDYHAPINELFYTGNDYKGEVGIEIEVEGQNIPQAIKSYWQAKPDHSLRGESSEYVLKQPCARRSVLTLLKYLKKQLDLAHAKIVPSPRTSVHVHINMAQHSLTQVYTYLTLYFIVEELMTQIAGEARVGNVFCLRARDAEAYIDELTSMAKAHKFDPIRDNLKYTAVNVCPVVAYNSVEFRALRGTVDPVTINEWVKLLLALKDASLGYADPPAVMQDFSRLGSREFLRKIYGDFLPLFIQQDGWEQKLWDGARLVQEVAYATDWEEREDEKKNPKRFFDVEPQRQNPEPDWQPPEDLGEGEDDDDGREED